MREGRQFIGYGSREKRHTRMDQKERERERERLKVHFIQKHDRGRERQRKNSFRNMAEA